MNFRLLFTLAIIIVTKVAISQNSSIKGKVVDEKTGETLPGAVVMINGTTTGGNTDFDGNFSINNVSPGTYNLVCKLISYNTKNLTDVIVKSGEPTIVTISLGSASTDLGVVEVTATMSKETNNALFVMQKNNASVSDGISSESIRRTPDRSTSDVLKRVSGASIQDNKFAIIRGLNDRYNSAYINGAPLPSSESDRKAFAFDIFPSNMLDNLIIIKTATPDLPGEFAGGIIQINTKSIPEKNEQTISIGTGFNTVTTFKNFKTYEGGKTDFLGIDDGSRAIPAGIPSTTEYERATIDEKAEYGKKMTGSWKINNTTALPNLSLQYSMANVGKVFKREAGSLFAITYNNNFSRNEITRREYEEQTTGVVKRMELQDTLFTQSILASAMWNLSLKLNDNNQLSLKNIYSVNTDDKVAIRGGAREYDQPEKYWEKASLRWYTQNNLLSSQLIGSHLLPKSKIKINWIGGLSNISRDVPNMRRMVYQKVSATEADPTAQYAAVVQNEGTIPNAAGNMFFSNTKENILSLKYDATLPVDIKKTKTDIKIGGFHQFRDRKFSSRSLGFSKYRRGSAVKFDSELLYLPEDQIFSAENMGVTDQVGPYNGGFKLDEATKTSDSYQASSMLNAGFLMLDTKVLEKLRFIYGARLESYNQRIETIKDGTSEPIVVDTTVNDILPSLNIVYSLNDKMNIRGSYYRTVARPEFRELAPFIFFDFLTDFAVSGNLNLQRTIVDNYDLRYEWYPGVGQLFSVSAFYKNFTNPIEMANRPDVLREQYYINAPNATNVGFEFEYRVKLSSLFKADSNEVLNSITFFSNFAYIISKVDVSKINGATAEERPLQGQSPLLVNAGLFYSHPTNGFSAAVSYNYVGRRLYLIGSTSEPDYWENPRHLLDLQLSKRFKEKFEVKLNIKDVLAQNAILYQDIDKNKKYDKEKDNTMVDTKNGQTISLSLSYKF